MQPDSPSVRPASMRLARGEQKLSITWQDGGRTELDAVTLRKACPCATCNEERKQKSANPLHIMQGAADEDPKIVGAELVGHYAVKLIWSDGHDTGIFDFRYLRTLGEDPAEEKPSD